MAAEYTAPAGSSANPASEKKKAARRRLSNWWRRRDSLFHPFRDGLDYAFILPEQDAGRVIRPLLPDES
jgi:hypothetical protein